VLLVCCAFLNCSTNQEEHPKPNIILITIDALRFDHVTFATVPDALTPRLASLAAQSSVFTQAISSFQSTPPAMASLMTGRYPSFEGVEKWGPATFHGFSDLNDADEEIGLTRNVRTLAEILSAHGYRTLGFSTNPNLSSDLGFDQGFDEYHEFSGFFLSKKIERRYLETIGRPAHPILNSYPPAETVIDEVLDRLGKSPPEPFFLWAHLMDPHSPYLPPPHLVSSAKRTKDRSISDLELNEALSGIVRRQRGSQLRPGFATPESLGLSLEELGRRLELLYEDEIRYSDYHLGRLWDALHSAALIDQTLIVVTADHGEEFLDHGHLIHHLLEAAPEELIRIPLLLHLPSGLHQEQQLHQLVRMIDIVPTLTDYAGLDQAAHGMDGVSLRPLIEASRPLQLTAFVSAIDFGVARSDHWKLRYDKQSGQQMLFDVRQDPLELDDKTLDFPKVLAEMSHRYTEFVTNLKQRSGPRQHREPPANLDPELRRRLEALGYLD
jgi:arylsulfatase A-like enzyme